MNRYYASSIGRFTSPDPYRASAGPENPQSWNRYAYVENDPVNYNDPEGSMRRKPDPGPGFPFPLYDPSVAPALPPGGESLNPGDGGGGPSNASVLKVSRTRLVDRIDDDCAEAIGARDSADALRRLESMSISFGSASSLRTQTDSRGNIVAVDSGQELGHYNGGVLGVGQSITLNSAVNWVNPDKTQAVNQKGDSVTYNLLTAKAFQLGVTSISAGQFMDLTLLHELAHSFHRDHPVDNATAFDKNIWTPCFKW